MGRRLATILGKLALYLALVVWLTWPLATHLRSHLPNTNIAGRSEPLYLPWVLAWEAHALTTAPLRFLDANIFHPARHALFYCDTALGALPYFLPPYLLTGNPALAINLVFLAGVVLTACALDLVVLRWTTSHAAGLVAAWTFLMNPATLWTFMPWAPNYALLHYLPVIALMAATPAPSLGAAVRLVPLVVLQCLGNLVYLTPTVLGPLGVLALGRLVRRTTRAAGLRLLAALALAMLVLVPFAAGHLAVRVTDPGLGQQSPWRAPRPEVAERLRSHFVPIGNYYYVPTHVPAGFLGNHHSPAIPYTVLGLLVGALLARSGRRLDPGARAAWVHGALWALVGLVMATPAVKLLGGEPIPLPHYGLAAWLVPSALEIVRAPQRFALASQIGVTLLAGAAFATCARRLSGLLGRPAFARGAIGCLATVVVALTYLEYRPFAAPSYPLRAAPTPDAPFVRALRVGEGPVLELPVRDQTGPLDQLTAMYRSIFHWRPLVNGYANYWPPGFADRMALAQLLPRRGALQTLHRETGLTTVAVRLEDMRPPQRAVWIALADRGGGEGLRLVAREEGALLFAVEP